MAHFARLDENNVVTAVVVVSNDVATDEQTGIDFLRNLFQTNDKFAQTSYNTIGGTHILGGTPFRMNYAHIGATYDEGRDAFLIPQPYPSWVLNEDTCLWNAPIEKPTDGNNNYDWDEENQQWVEITVTEVPE